MVLFCPRRQCDSETYHCMNVKPAWVCASTCSDHPLNADPGWVNFFSEFMDGLSGIFVRVWVHICLYSWKRDYQGKIKYNIRFSIFNFTVISYGFIVCNVNTRNNDLVKLETSVSEKTHLTIGIDQERWGLQLQYTVRYLLLFRAQVFLLKSSRAAP